MSRLPERKEKDCLNCSTVVHGRYCHKCGQENLEVKESVWHLLVHFFNDVTHFDGKFFSSLKYLLFRPGFLTKEYSEGKRTAYLNPIRMYLFTSAIFFLIYYSFIIKDHRQIWTESKWEDTMRVKAPLISDDQFRTELIQLVETDPAFKKEYFITQIKNAQASIDKKNRNTVNFSTEDADAALMNEIENTEYRWLYNKILDWEIPVDSLAILPDTAFATLLSTRISTDSTGNRSSFLRFVNGNGIKSTLFIGNNYRDRAEYDSMLRKGSAHHNWFWRQIIYKQLALNKKFQNNQKAIINAVMEKFEHSIPQMLFLSLPILALVLKFLYYRRKQFYYVEHGILVIHNYIFILILTLVSMALKSIESGLHTNFLWVIDIGLMIWNFIYVYKSMRNFYQQRRFKTIVKFLLLLLSTLFIMIFIFMFFLFFSIFTM